MFSQLQHRIQKHPEELLPVFQDFHKLYKKVKQLRNVDMKLAMATIDTLLQKVHCLQRLPVESVPLSLDLWTKHLNRIYNVCQQEKASIQEAYVKWSALESSIATHDTLPEERVDTALSPWINDWNDETLQSESVKRLVRDIIVPVLYSGKSIAHSSVDARSRTLVVAGPSNVGKSYAIQSIHDYLRQRNCPLQWIQLSVYDCPSYAQGVLQEERTSSQTSTKKNANEWTIMVTDGVPSTTLDEWSTQHWCMAWLRHLRQRPKTLWIVLTTIAPTEQENDYTHVHTDNISTNTTASRPLSHVTSVTSSLFPVDYFIHKPDAKTVYHYFKKRIFQHYASSDTLNANPFPKYTYLPIVNQLPQLAQFATDYVQKNSPTYENIDQLFLEAIQYCEECSLNENGLFGVVTHPSSKDTDTQPLTRWYPKNSVRVEKLPETYKYKLLQHSKHDCVEWCPETTEGNHSKCTGSMATFWNIQLFDQLPFCEYDRFTHIYVDPRTIDNAEKEDYDLIATFPVQTSIFPYHLQHDLEMCYEWALSFGCGIFNTLQESSDVNTLSHTTYIETTEEVLNRTDSQCVELFKNLYPQKMHFANVTTSSQVWYIEKNFRGDVSESLNAFTPHFHITYRSKHSSKISEFINGVPYNISANQLQQLLTVLLDSDREHPCSVVQVQTYRGYAYYIDFSVELEQSFRLVSADKKCSITMYPQIALPVLMAGFDLDMDYKICTESEINALIEQYPRDYKDVYIDEEVSWKLKPIRKQAHVSFLNKKYTMEQKCYLKLFSDLLCAKVAHYACLTSEQRMVLDETLTDLQNHLDFVMQIIPENDHTGKWNEVWSMDHSHPHFEHYHPPNHDEVDKVMPVKLATEWLRHDASFTMSPRWLKTLTFLCELYQNTENTRQNMSSPTLPLCTIAQTWKAYRKKETHTDTQWIYVKSSVSKTFWANAKDHSRVFSKTQLTLRNKTLHHRVLKQYNQTIQKHSLFFEVFRQADYIGFHDKKSNCIHWNTFQPFSQTDPLCPTLQALNKEPKLWLLLFKHYPEVYTNWLYTMYQMSQHDLSYQMMYAHLLYYPSIHYWSLDTYNASHPRILSDIQHQKNIDTFIRQYAFIHNQIHKKQFVLHGALPGKYVRHAIHRTQTVSLSPTLSKQEKQVMTNEEKMNICLYGLDLHHLTDVVPDVVRIIGD